MNNTRLLTQVQAQSIYSSMRHLDEVDGGAIGTSICGVDKVIKVREMADGRVLIERFSHPVERIQTVESYPNRHAFVAAYGLGA